MRLLKGMEGVDLAEHRWVALCRAPPSPFHPRNDEQARSSNDDTPPPCCDTPRAASLLDACPDKQANRRMAGLLRRTPQLILWGRGV